MSNLRPARQNQQSDFTSYNRYPRIFRFVGDLIQDSIDLKVLSFGCSKGVEVKSLRDLYFPLAQIDGTDTKQDRLDAARGLNHGQRSEFLLPEEMHDRQYDVVFAMSVLCLHPHNSHTDLPFEDFDTAVRAIDACLKVGGILACYNLQYHLEESSVGQHYSPIIDKELHAHYTQLATPPVLVRKYWKDGTPFGGISPVIYRKIIE